MQDLHRKLRGRVAYTLKKKKNRQNLNMGKNFLNPRKQVPQ